jgi:SagB-type dehydrogenase family enzyme
MPWAIAVVCALAIAGMSQRGFASGEGEPTRTTMVSLPEPKRTGEVSVEGALAARRSVRSFAGKPLPLPKASQLLWAAQGRTHPAGLRTAPSAGALYPLELYLIAGAVSELEQGLYRYDPDRHHLERLRAGDARAQTARAAFHQDWLAEAPAILVLTAIYARTERKYGERATRYVHMEVGHAAENVYLQAVALGLGTTMVGAFDDDALVRALGLPAQEKPLALLPVGYPD